VKGVVYGLMFARWLKPRKEVWREEAARMARGPKRAPTLDDIRVGRWVEHEWENSERDFLIRTADVGKIKLVA
jgi:hypothetical protein